jgi:hypothetical protein
MSKTKKLLTHQERGHTMKRTAILASILVCLLLVCATAFAQVTRVDKPISVQASVTGSSSFDVKIYKSTSSTTYDWATDYINAMNFGALVPADASKPTTSALGASQHFMALVTVNNNTGATYRVQFTGAPLRHTDATTTLPNNAWTVTAGNQINTDGSVATVYPAGVNTGRFSAGVTTAYSVYTSNTSGLSDVFRVYCAITGDPTKAVSSTGALIPPTQKSGTYSASVTLTLLP